jgi:hypothetical protein
MVDTETFQTPSNDIWNLRSMLYILLTLQTNCGKIWINNPFTIIYLFQQKESKKMSKSIFTIVVLTVLMSISQMISYAAGGFEYIPDNHTLALWHMNEGSGDKIADESPNSFEGVVEGNHDWGEEEWKKGGNAGSSFVFDGTTFINIGNVKELITPNAITVEAWVYPEDLNGWKLICCNWSGPPGAFHLACDNATPKFHINTTNGGANASASQQLQTSQWYHIAGTYDSGSGEIQIFIDGEVAGTANHGGNLADNDYDVIIGAKHAGDFPWNGMMDEVRISDIVRESDELSANLTKPMPVNALCTLTTTWGVIKDR